MKKIIGFVAALCLSGVSSARATGLEELAELPGCNALPYTQSLALHPDAFGEVTFEIAFDDYRGWVKKKIKNYVSLAKRGHARKRKRNKATIIVRTKSAVSCRVKAKIRAHGDLGDHYPGDMTEEPSLNISLVDGHIFGITKFILFRPETRNGKNEVFAATLLAQQGFLSPRTSMATMSLVGGNKPSVKVIFQEKIVKEFLEAGRFREGPIIEGDERFGFSQKYAHLKKGAALARISNYKWARKGPTSMAIAEKALMQFNKLLFRYDKSWATIYGSNMVDIVELAQRLQKGNQQLTFVNYPVFEAVIFSMAGTHGFSQDDRRAVYDPVSNSLTPIYYDGGSTILTKPDEKLDRNITLSAQKAVPDATKLVKGLDVGELEKALKVRGVDIGQEKLRSAIASMLKRLDAMATSSEVEPVKVKARTLYRKANNRLSYVFNTDQQGEVEVCRDSLEQCRLFKPDRKIMAVLLAQNWVDPKGFPAIYFAFKKSELDKPFTGFADRQATATKHKKVSLGGFRLDLYGDISQHIDRENRKITLKRTGASGRAVISNGQVDGWTVEFDDVSGHVKDTKNGEQNFDRQGLTGCLTVIDAELSDLQLTVNNATCEDAVNLVRVTGNVKSARIRNAAFDAVDSDFSTLKFDNLRVEKAGNDCLDLSYGTYRATNLNLVECADKAVSIGETSKAQIETLFAKNVGIGLAAKDYGSILLGSGKIENSKQCFQLYNKKQEFSGGLLEIKAGVLDCGGVAGKVGPTSLVRGYNAY